MQQCNKFPLIISKQARDYKQIESRDLTIYLWHVHSIFIFVILFVAVVAVHTFTILFYDWLSYFTARC